VKRASIAFAIAFTGCGGSPTSAPPTTAPAAASIDVEAARWLPAKDDTVFAYDTRDLVSGTTGVFMLRARRAGDARLDLIGPKRTEHLIYKPEGILREREGTYLLRTPVKEGTSWPGGPNATMRIGRVGISVKVAAGEFDRCAEVIEDRTGAVRGTITTTFCADVGIVTIETLGEGDGAQIHERVELKSFAPAIDIGAPGVRALGK
jgi:hypothetical protein